MAGESGLFDGGSACVWTIPAGADFLKALAGTLAQATGLAERADALSDAVIYVPNRRSARALTLALFDAGGGRTILPPDIRALGDLESDEPPPLAETALAELPPVLSPGKQLGALASLVQAFHAGAHGHTIPPASALTAARELSRLLDQAALSEHSDWSKLDGLIDSPDLAVHWTQSLSFLKIISDQWPQWLRDNNVTDPYSRRLHAAEALVARWSADAPQAPVVIAGSTGATPAGRLLMRAALDLPKGAVVLPGFDLQADETAWDAIRNAASHPQNALIRTLDAIGRTQCDVRLWPGISDRPEAEDRRRLIHEALAPADATSDWLDTLKRLAGDGHTAIPDFARSALSGLGVVETPNETAEAEAAALLMREVLTTDGETAALVTPDAGLARRVSALLKRWELDVPPSAGVPLGRTPAGSLIGLCARWAVDPGDPVALSAVMKHSFVIAPESADDLERYFLRGPRRWKGLDELRESIDQRRDLEAYPNFSRGDQDRAIELVKRLESLFAETGADLSTMDEIFAGDGARRIALLAERIGETPMPWAGEDGRKASSLLERIDELSPFLGPMSPTALADLIESEAANLTVSAGVVEHPRLSIWGPLEARLQSADRVILAGLNEDVWPQRAPPDAYLPRRFRPAVGLSDPEERLGLSAHDFAQLACAPQVVMLYAARRDDSPAVASRWVWRLQTLAEGALGRVAAGEALAPSLPIMDWVAAMQRRGRGRLPADFSSEPKPTSRPKNWPEKLSVTRVDVLQRDPYALWAEHVLGLSRIDGLKIPLDARYRGTAIHKALERFEKEPGPNQPGRLMGLLEAELRRTGEPEATWESRRAVWADVCAWYADWREVRDVLPGAVEFEVRGARDFEIAGAPFRLTATSDRVERLPDGRIVIVDYKSGDPPTDKAIGVGFDQQMPLQAVIAAGGGFRNIPAAQVAALEYVAFKGKPLARVVGEGKSTPEEFAAIAHDGLIRLITDYRMPDAVYRSAPRVKFVKYDSGYNLLARRDEWSSESGDGGGDG